MNPDNKFKKLVLLPLQVSKRPCFDCACKYESQFHYLIDVMENISPEIGVVVTEHPIYPVMKYEWLEYFRWKYKNFIYNKEFQYYGNTSQFLINKTDGIINISSSIGITIFILWKTSF
ncbi:MAG: hypothetical protein MZU91_05825 [Desulfosudis oleivorans]|nr:hypothetical protein [Desulfosudis oleivorans]